MAEIIEKSQEQWIERENELLREIEKLKLTNGEIVKDNDLKYITLTDSLSKSKLEIDDLLSKVSILDKELKQKQILSQATGEIAKEYDTRDELIKKAKELLFEKSKISKNQELQIAALSSQLLSIKDVLDVTKEMLEVRNCEVDHMKLRLDSVELRLKTERDLIEKKLIISQKMYNHLKSEHELQSNLFKELKHGYKTKVELVTAELNKLKEQTGITGTSKTN